MLLQMQAECPPKDKSQTARYDALLETAHSPKVAGAVSTAQLVSGIKHQGMMLQQAQDIHEAIAETLSTLHG